LAQGRKILPGRRYFTAEVVTVYGKGQICMAEWNILPEKTWRFMAFQSVSAWGVNNDIAEYL